MELNKKYTEQDNWADNAVTKIPVVILLDISGSMAQHIDNLNFHMNSFIRECSNDNLINRQLEVAILTFNDSVAVAQLLTSVKEISPTFNFSANGGTNTSQALEKAITILEDRKTYYKSNGITYSKPWLVLMTDGQDSYTSVIKTKIVEYQQMKKLVLFNIGFGGSEVAESLKQLNIKNKALMLDPREGFAPMFDFFKKAARSTSTSITAGTIPNIVDEVNEAFSLV